MADMTAFFKKILYRLLGLSLVSNIEKVNITNNTVILVKIPYDEISSHSQYVRLRTKMEELFPSNMILYYNDEIGYQFIERHDCGTT